MRISIIGAGYVGLVTAACLAAKGHQVICVDVDQEKVDKINRAIPPIYERGLAELLANSVNTNLWATADLEGAVIDTDVTFIAVGTPFDGHQIDLTHVREASCAVGAGLRSKTNYHLVVVKSTVVPGTTDEIVRPLLEEYSGKKAGIDFGLAMNPEFLTEGVAVRDFLLPDRIVLGGIDRKSLDILIDLYSAFEGVPKIRTNNKTAEMIKYVSNALLATMISFSNEIGNLCAASGDIDVVEVMSAIHINNYLSIELSDGSRGLAPITAFLEAGCGFGGSCLPKDVKALISHGRKMGSSMELLRAVVQINECQYQQILRLLRKHFPALVGTRIAVLGLAFKPDTGDMRESPAIPIIAALLADKAQVKAYDPVAVPEARKLFGDKITLCDDIRRAIADVEAIVIVTRWSEFEVLPQLLADREPQPVVIDGRRILDKDAIAKYEGVGL